VEERERERETRRIKAIYQCRVTLHGVVSTTKRAVKVLFHPLYALYMGMDAINTVKKLNMLCL